MHYDYGPYLTCRADLHREIEVCLEYCESDRFVVPYFAEFFARSLRTIQAWCADGREPQFPERMAAPRMGWVIGRELDDAGVPRDGEWGEMAIRIQGIGAYFAYWPTDQQIVDGVRLIPASIMTRPTRPTGEEVRLGVDRIEAAIRAAGHWSDRPLPSTNDPGAMTHLERLQYVLLPNLRAGAAGTMPLPEKSGLSHMGTGLHAERALWPVMYALSDFDMLFLEVVRQDNVLRWPPPRP